MTAVGDLSERCVVVTGGGTGIGKAIAHRFVAAGASVVLAGRRRDALEEAAASLGSAAHAAPTDVTDEASVAKLFHRATQLLGKVDVLVNSAGAFTGGRADDVELADFQRVMAVNVTGMFLCSRAAMRQMRPRGGRIINVGSLAGQRARPGSSAYAASKHAVWGLTQALALDGRDDEIVVSCLNPGNTAVARRADGRSATGGDDASEPMMAPEDVAEVALLMASLPSHVNLVEATILPNEQSYLGRG